MTADPLKMQPTRVAPRSKSTSPFAGGAAAEPVTAPELSGPTDEEKIVRAERIPVGTQVQKMAFAARQGFVRRWVNDVPGRLDEFSNAGYAFVRGPDGKNVTKVVDRKTGLIAYMMEQLGEFYTEDQERKSERLDEVDEQIYGGTHNQEPGDHRYVPKSTPINLQVRTGPGRG